MANMVSAKEEHDLQTLLEMFAMGVGDVEHFQLRLQDELAALEVPELYMQSAWFATMQLVHHYCWRNNMAKVQNHHACSVYSNLFTPRTHRTPTWYKLMRR